MTTKVFLVEFIWYEDYELLAVQDDYEAALMFATHKDITSKYGVQNLRIRELGVRKKVRFAMPFEKIYMLSDLCSSKRVTPPVPKAEEPQRVKGILTNYAWSLLDKNPQVAERLNDFRKEPIYAVESETRVLIEFPGLLPMESCYFSAVWWSSNACLVFDKEPDSVYAVYTPLPEEKT